MQTENEDQPATAEESAAIERFASVGGDAPLSPKYGGPTVPESHPEPEQPAAPVDVTVIHLDPATAPPVVQQIPPAQ